MIMVELTNTEENIMKCLWSLNKDATVADLLSSLEETFDKSYARTTISVFMSYLRDKGYVAYEKRSHAFVYHPLISEESYQKEMLKRHLERYFNNSLPAFVEAILVNLEPDEKTSDEILRIMTDYRAKLG